MMSVSLKLGYLDLAVGQLHYIVLDRVVGDFTQGIAEAAYVVFDCLYPGFCCYSAARGLSAVVLVVCISVH